MSIARTMKLDQKPEKISLAAVGWFLISIQEKAKPSNLSYQLESDH